MDELFSLDDAERRAEAVVSPDAWAYMAGGAGDERTLQWNREAFSEFRLRPRVLVDVSAVTTETTVLGTPVSMPALVAPMAFQAIAHEEGEVAMARGAAAAGTLMCLSTVATSTPADVAAAAPDAPRWLQIYVFRDREVSDEVIGAGDRGRLLGARPHRRPARVRHPASRGAPRVRGPGRDRPGASRPRARSA